MRLRVLPLLAVPLAACAGPGPVSDPFTGPRPNPGALAACPLPRLHPMIAVEFFMGRDIAGRSPITDAEWGSFVASDITPRFPAGFTVLDARGQWRDPAGRTASEPAHLVRVWTEATPDLPARVEEVAAAYKSRFRQLAVGVAVTSGCADFSQ